MRTLALLVFIGGAAAVAIFLARQPTVADGRVMEADLLAQLRNHGVIGMACDPKIPLGRSGAVFTCVLTLGQRRHPDRRIHDGSRRRAESEDQARERPDARSDPGARRSVGQLTVI